MERYDAREAELGEELMRALERFLLLQIIDERWREHLYDMDYLREGIHLRGFAQIEPLVAYKNEAFTLFGDLMNSIWTDFARMIFHVQVDARGRQRRRRRPGACLRGGRQLDRARARLLLGRRRRDGRRRDRCRRRGSRGRSRSARRRTPPTAASEESRWRPSSSSASSTPSSRSGATTPAGAGREEVQAVPRRMRSAVDADSVRVWPPPPPPSRSRSASRRFATS